jgi:hypothetical protein
MDFPRNVPGCNGEASIKEEDLGTDYCIKKADCDNEGSNCPCRNGATSPTPSPPDLNNILEILLAILEAWGQSEDFADFIQRLSGLFSTPPAEP